MGFSHMALRTHLISLLALAAPIVASAQASHLPWAQSARPPAVSDLHLLESREDLDAALGPPDSVLVVREGYHLLMYSSRGVAVLLPRYGGAEELRFTTPAAGAIDSRRVGATEAEILRKWGPPQRHDGPDYVYLLRTWKIVVQWDRQLKHVATLVLAENRE
jgi:hypothetical protein